MRLRIRFSKLGKVRFTSHRDVARIWERAVRRAGVAVKYSEGFAPRPRLSFGLALSTGAESVAEYVDIELADELDGGEPSAVAAQLDAALPVGFAVMAAEAVGPEAGSLQQDVTSCGWEIDLYGVDLSTTRAAVERLLAAETVVVKRERKGKPVEDDLRPGVLSLHVADEPHDTTDPALPVAVRLVAELGAQPRALRPSELLDALGLPFDDARVRRTHQWIHDGAARRELLPLAPSAITARADARDSRRESTDVRPTGHRPPDANGGGTGAALSRGIGGHSAAVAAGSVRSTTDEGAGPVSRR